MRTITHIYMDSNWLIYSDSEDKLIDVLIGSDYYWDFVTSEIVRGDFGPTAVNSKFGWLLSGPMLDCSSSQDVSSNLVISVECSSMFGEQDDELVESLKKFWESESVEIIPED